MHLVGEIFSVVSAKGATSLDTTWLCIDSKYCHHLFSFSSSVAKMFPLRSRTGGSDKGCLFSNFCQFLNQWPLVTPSVSLNFSVFSFILACQCRTATKGAGCYVLLQIIPHFYESPRWIRHPHFRLRGGLPITKSPAARYNSFASQFKFGWEGLLKLCLCSSTLRLKVPLLSRI